MEQKIVALDTSIFIYLLEEHPEYVRKAERIISDVRDGRYVGVFSSIGMIELLTGPKKLGRFDLAEEYERHLSSFPNLRIVGMNERIAWLASDFRAKYGIGTPDAIHLATAVNAHASIFYTNDKALTKIKELPVRLL
jgi:predicted nucleic acid-binding protein